MGLAVIVPGHHFNQVDLVALGNEVLPPSRVQMLIGEENELAQNISDPLQGRTALD
jgi:hypothetical protein